MTPGLQREWVAGLCTAMFSGGERPRPHESSVIGGMTRCYVTVNRSCVYKILVDGNLDVKIDMMHATLRYFVLVFAHAPASMTRTHSEAPVPISAMKRKLFLMS
jgi:hypothetical protein